MARTNLSLSALGTACGTAANLNACSGGTSQVSLLDFAVDTFNAPSGPTLINSTDPADTFTYTVTGTSLGSKFLTRIAAVTGKVEWGITGAATTTIATTFLDTSGGMTFTLNSNGDPISDAFSVYYKVIDGFNVNATGYNTQKTLSVSYSYDTGCFLLGTKVLMGDNTYKNIEDIKIGDFVVSFDFNSRLYFPKLVEKTLVHKANEYWIINNKLKVTPNHKLWVNDILSTVGKIKRGDFLRNEHYERVWVYDIQKRIELNPFHTYNLKVADTHNYLAEGLLVHNKCPFVYTSYQGVETCHGTILTNFSGVEGIDTKDITLPFDTIIIREIEPETSHFQELWFGGIKLAGSFTLDQGEEKIFKISNTEGTTLFARGHYNAYI